MFDAGHDDSIVQRGIAEALACQDMLERAPIRRPPLARTMARLGAWAHGLVRRGQDGRRRVAPTVPINTLTR